MKVFIHDTNRRNFNVYKYNLISPLHVPAKRHFQVFFPSVISHQSTRYSMSWCAGWLTIVVRSPAARRSLSWIQSLLIDLWLLYLLSTQTMVNHGDPPPTRKIPMVEPGIEPGTSWLVVRSSDHQTTRLVDGKYTTRFKQIQENIR
jgi:hypothetical protein